MLAAKLKRVALPFFLAAVFIVSTQLASTAQAMCVYNNMDVQMEVTFDCGIFCSNNWTIDPNGYNCRPSEAGTVLLGPGCGEGGCLYYASIDVDAHGYVVLSGTGGAGSTRSMCAFHEDDSLAGCVNFTYP